MITAYLDSSVIVRVVLSETAALEEWNTLEAGVSSVLARAECHRSLERRWRNRELTDEQFESKRAALNATLGQLDLRPVDSEILGLASNPFPTWVATLDAIHLATALAYRRAQQDDGPILFATHDRQLAKAATALHFDVIGLAA